MLNLRLSRLLRRPLLRFSNGETDASISTSSSETPPSNHGPFREGVSHREDDHLSGEFTQLGFGKSPPLNVSEAESGEIRNPSFNSFDEIDELGGEEDDEDDEESVDERDDDDFAVLESFGKIPRSREDVNSRFDVEEDESRHPLVRETNRLINLRSSWNPKHEGEMRNLLRSLKPSSQVCAFSGLQDDERVSLKFFYWSDLSGPLMKRRGNRISRAGQLRDALKVLDLNLTC